MHGISPHEGWERAARRCVVICRDARYASRVGIGIITFLLFAVIAAHVSAYELGLNIHGLSYHPDEQDSNGRPFDSINPGIGLRLVIHESGRHVWLSEGGLYKNSSGSTSKYFGGGYRFKLPANFEIGPSVVLYHSPDQNSGEAFLTPLIVLSWEYKRLQFHAVPVPRYKDVNRNAAVGFFITVSLWRND